MLWKVAKTETKRQKQDRVQLFLLPTAGSNLSTEEWGTEIETARDTVTRPIKRNAFGPDEARSQQVGRCSRGRRETCASESGKRDKYRRVDV